MTSAAASDHRRAALALSLARGVGSVRWREALAAADGDAGRALGRIPRAARDAADHAAADALARADALGAEMLLLGEPAYPAALLDLPDPPPALFALGDVALLASPAIAIVGTRDATGYGRRVARHLAEAGARAGAVIVSGMARGVDGEAHLGALAVDGATIAVLGTGVDVAYPRAHLALHRGIAERGLVLSELPPGCRADAGSFPRRNRLIAALAAVTVVVEAGHRSGALITAGHALELGRAVAAVPGPIDAAASAGCNRLLRDGAQVVTDAEDVTTLAGVRAARPRSAPDLAGAQLLVWGALADGAADVDTLVARTRLPTRDCLGALGELELSGHVTCALTGEIARR